MHFFWGSFDLALTRYSGRPATPPPNAGIIFQHSADAEQICAGFWPGHQSFPAPAFFAYAYPKPSNIEAARIGPDAATWNPDLGEFVLTYDAARAASNPRQAILTFLDDTYQACAAAAGWRTDLVPKGETWPGIPAPTSTRSST